MIVSECKYEVGSFWFNGKGMFRVDDVTPHYDPGYGFQVKITWINGGW